MFDRQTSLCHKCGKQSTVKDKRDIKGAVRRRRACECGHRWSTIEVNIGDLRPADAYAIISGYFDMTQEQKVQALWRMLRSNLSMQEEEVSQHHSQGSHATHD